MDIAAQSVAFGKYSRCHERFLSCHEWLNGLTTDGPLERLVALRRAQWLEVKQKRDSVRWSGVNTPNRFARLAARRWLR